MASTPQDDSKHGDTGMSDTNPSPTVDEMTKAEDKRVDELITAWLSQCKDGNRHSD